MLHTVPAIRNCTLKIFDLYYLGQKCIKWDNPGQFWTPQIPNFSKLSLIVQFDAFLAGILLVKDFECVVSDCGNCTLSNTLSPSITIVIWLTYDCINTTITTKNMKALCRMSQGILNVHVLLPIWHKYKQRKIQIN